MDINYDAGYENNEQRTERIKEPNSKVEMLKAELQEIIDTEEDAICIYCMDSVNYTVKEEIGITRKTGNII